VIVGCTTLRQFKIVGPGPFTIYLGCVEIISPCFTVLVVLLWTQRWRGSATVVHGNLFDAALRRYCWYAIVDAALFCCCTLLIFLLCFFDLCFDPGFD
jgi:hypothetical protein